MRTADILPTLERIAEDIEKNRPVNMRQFHKLKTWLRSERERLDARQVDNQYQQKNQQKKKG
jgi:hypothetical protein